MSKDLEVVTGTCASGNRHTDIGPGCGPWLGSWTASSPSSSWSRSPWRWACQTQPDCRFWKGPVHLSCSPWTVLLVGNQAAHTPICVAGDLKGPCTGCQLPPCHSLQAGLLALWSGRRNLCLHPWGCWKSPIHSFSFLTATVCHCVSHPEDPDPSGINSLASLGILKET